MRKIILLAVLMGLGGSAFAQTAIFNVVSDGYWNVPGNWSCACIPNGTNTTSIQIPAGAVVRVNTDITPVTPVDQMIIEGDASMVIESGGTFRLTGIIVVGVDLQLDLANFGSTFTNAFVEVQSGGVFVNGGQILDDGGLAINAAQMLVTGRYEHNQNGNAIPPITWDVSSTCSVTGWTTTTTGALLNDFRNSLVDVDFYHFTWNSSGQTAGVVPLDGLLGSGPLGGVRGNLTIQNTNSRRVTLGYVSPVANGSVTIGGNLDIGADGKLNFGSSGTYAITVRGNATWQYNNTVTPTQNQNAYLIHGAGVSTTVTIDGDLTIANTGELQLNAASGASSLVIGGNFTFNGGTISKTGASPSTGAFTFTGGGATHTYTRGGGTFSNHIVTYNLLSGGTLNLGSNIIGTASARLISDGTVIFGSASNNATLGTGAITGNFPGTTRTFNSGSIVYQNASSGQFMGVNDQPDGVPGANVTTTINTSNGVSLQSASSPAKTTLALNNMLTLQSGNLNVGANNTLTLTDLTANANFLGVAASSSLVINGSAAFGTLPLTGSATLTNFTLNRSTSGTLTLGSALGITGAFTQTQGRLDLNGNTLTISGTYTGTASIGPGTASSLIFNGGGALPSIAFQTGTLNTLTLNRTSATLATTGNAITATNLFMTNGTFTPGVNLFNMASGGTITVNAGILSSTPGSTGSYNVLYVNGSPRTGSAEIPGALITNRLNNVTINGGASVELPNTCTINGILNISNGSLDAQGFTVTLLGNFICDGTAALTSSTFTFDGNTTISGSNIPDFGNMVLNGSRTLTMPVALNVVGDIQLTAGATFNHSSGTINLTGSTLQSIAGGGLTMNNLVANKTGSTDVILTSALNLLGTLNVQSTNTVFHSDGFLRLISTTDAASGNARVAPLTATGASVAGDVIVERYMSAEGRIFRHISSPVSGHSVAALQGQGIPVTGTFAGASTGCTGCTTNPSMQTYNVNTSAFVQFPLATNAEALTSGAGYLLFIRQDIIGPPVNINYTGPINQGDYSPVLTHVGGGNSWNLVGNPYPSSIDWDIIAGWTKTNISGVVAVQDSPFGAFRYWNGSVASGVDPIGLAGGEIAKGQGFWVRTTAGSPVLTLHEQAKISTAAPFYREGAPDPDVMTIKVSDVRGLADGAVIQLDPSAKSTVGVIDELDAPKIPNLYMDLSTRIGVDPTRMAINAIDAVSCDKPVAIEMQFAKTTAGAYVFTPTGTYTFKFGFQGTKWAGRTVKVIDTFRDSTFTVTNGKEYKFTISQATPASFAANRFSLQFGDEDTNLNLAVTGDETTCLGGQASLTVGSTQAGFKYYLTNGTEQVSEELEGNGSDLVFTVPASELVTGSNNFSVNVKGMCSFNTLNSSWGVTKQEMQQPGSADMQSCGSAKFALTATGAGANETYQWYETIDAASSIGNEPTYVTTVLQQSKTYYVSVRSQYGCESDRIAVKATIMNLPAAAIAVDNDTFTSNFDTGNQWSFNDQAIDGATGKTFTATESGTYSLTVTTNDGCAKTVNTTYARATPGPGPGPTPEPEPEPEPEIITGDIIEPIHGARAYPNPVSDNLFIEFGKVNGPVDITLMNELGANVKSVSLSGRRSASISMGDLSGGVYFVKIAGGGAVKTLKVVKISQ